MITDLNKDITVAILDNQLPWYFHDEQAFKQPLEGLSIRIHYERVCLLCKLLDILGLEQKRIRCSFKLRGVVL